MATLAFQKVTYGWVTVVCVYRSVRVGLGKGSGEVDKSVYFKSSSAGTRALCYPVAQYIREEPLVL